MIKFYRFLPLLTLFISFNAISQVDTEFWFAPPEVTSGHGDRPIFLRISSLDQAANVQVTMPARANLQIANITVSANTTQTIDLTTQISLLETFNPGVVMKTGIKIISSAPITAYYEVGATWNTDIFALKGKNALGNNFVIPVQKFYDNGIEYFPTPSFSFDIVATQNNTVVKVKLTEPTIGHPEAGEVTVKLNAGETYSFKKPTAYANDNPGGTIVESNKPIAITIKDDSVVNGGCRDLIGDQLVPVEVAGSEYVVVKGFLSSMELVFITAIEDNTEVYIGGNSTPAAHLMAGELFTYIISHQSTYVSSNKTIYVLHVTGFGCEMGMAVLPSINCKGSEQIGFARTTTEFFGLNVLVRKEGINDFILNGSSTLLPGSAFSPVPGTNDTWYVTQMEYNTQQIPVGQASLISNERYSFQVGIINGNAATSCRYGYFSAFSTLFIGDDMAICEGQSVNLDAGPGKESYLWSNGSTGRTIQVSDPGKYWVRAEKEECVLADTINLTVKKGKIDLGADKVFCDGDAVIVDGKENFSWLWSNGTTDQYLVTDQPGKYWVSVFDYVGCEASDTILLQTMPKPTVDLGEDIIKCPNEEVTLNAFYPGATYLWENGTTTASRSVKGAGTYWCKVSLNGCTIIDSLTIENLPGPPQDSIFGSPSVCPFVKDVDYNVDDVANLTYQWIVEGGAITQNDGPSIKVDWEASNPSALVKALITDEQGCKSDTLLFPVKINVVLQVELPIGPDTLCLNKAQHVVYTTPNTTGSVYDWLISGGSIIQGQGSNQVLVNWSEGLNKLWIEETSTTIDTVCQGTSPELSVYVFKDETAIELYYTSTDTLNDSNIVISWDILNTNRVQHDSVFVFKKLKDAVSWQLLLRLPAHVNSFTDVGNDTDHTVYGYYVSAFNLCDAPILSTPHHTIQLIAVVDTLKDEINFSWNQYDGWADGVDHYELWQKLDDAPGYTLLATIPSSERTFTSMTATAFTHKYVIQAIEKGGDNESWSNNVAFEFEHNVFIPNVFTPNNDTFNDFFEIKKIQLYKDSELNVMNRWGKTVYRAKAYQNDWNGGDLSTGVYYYVLDLKKKGKVIKGTISILR